ncbi:MAG: hypothetical protein JNJ88_21375 [Planctomycetes bacterium]|nr:hypothetical protein [Planctomycetota bacterium]
MAVGAPVLGQTIEVRTTDVVGSGAWTFACGAPGSLPFLDGEILVDLASYQVGAFSPASQGSAPWALAIPSLPALAGYNAYFQSVALDPSLPQGLAFSNGLRMVLCP